DREVAGAERQSVVLGRRVAVVAEKPAARSDEVGDTSATGNASREDGRPAASSNGDGGDDGIRADDFYIAAGRISGCLPISGLQDDRRVACIARDDPATEVDVVAGSQGDGTPARALRPDRRIRGSARSRIERDIPIGCGKGDRSATHGHLIYAVT